MITIFNLPVDPDEFSVELPPAKLRNISFSALDFNTAMRAGVEYWKTYYPQLFNDYVASSGAIMFLEAVSAASGKLALRADLIGNQAFIGTCTTERAMSEHLKLINQRMRRQTPAVTDIEFTLQSPVAADIRIKPGMKFLVGQPDGSPVYYEAYSSPGDFTSDIVIPKGRRGVIAYGIEGMFATPVSFVASNKQKLFTISDQTAIEDPIIVTVVTGSDSSTWRVIKEPIERYGPKDKVVEVQFFGPDMILRFGDDITGMALSSGQVVTIRYRSGGGIRGRIGTGKISGTIQVIPESPVTAPVQVAIRNVGPSSGGEDRETIDQARVRAPREFATAGSIVGDKDYVSSASSFSHPVFGSVAKAAVSLRSTRNANLVEVYCLVSGPGNTLSVPNIGLKRALKTYLDDINVTTDYVEVLDGALCPVDVRMNVIVNKNADATVVKTNVENVVSSFFNKSSWQMGQPFYLSNFIQAIEQVDGIAYVDVLSPTDNILATGKLADGSIGVGINQLIIEGSRSINYYYEATSK